MKNVLRSLFVVAALVAASSAHAVDRQAAVKIKWEPLVIRTFSATFPNGVDSTVFRAVGVESAPSAPLDTSIAYSTEGWSRRQSTAGAADTSVALIVAVGDAAGSSSCAACDSLRLAVQVSHDGSGWATALTFKGGTAASTITTGNNQTIVSGVFQDQISLNGAGVSPHIWVFKYKDRVVTGMDGADIGGLLDWPFIRFVLQYADGVDGYILSGKVGHFQAVEQ